jgi:acyl-CoA reductase-like NAD-dependent aldehyde dehydrogenase
MNETEIQSILAKQKEYFLEGKTLPYEARMEALSRLEETVRSRMDSICAALRSDLGKGKVESYTCEIALLLGEIRYMKKNLRKLMAPRKAKTALFQMPARCMQLPSPYGNVLIMSPWNYPFLLTLEPLVDALAAGNTAIVKPSAYAPSSMAEMQQILQDSFPEELVFTVTGGRAENQALLRQPFDKVFFTGSKNVGREVLRSQADHLTPVALELGGKSPVIVDRTADLAITARRLVFGKFINCGQTCVAPDYVLCPADLQEALADALRKEIRKQYGKQPLKNCNYVHMINEKHYQRVKKLIAPSKTVIGGAWDDSTLHIEPTVMTHVSWDDPVMQEEIFGPVLPILDCETVEDAIQAVNRRPQPLALYIFSQDRKAIETILERCRFGGGCINDTLLHLATSYMPFGGVGESGMGCYHGKAGFEEFSHLRSIVDQAIRPDPKYRYAPYTKAMEEMLKKFL